MRNNLIQEEKFFHWIWDNLQFDTRNLRTREGHPLQILDAGHHNASDGPDFLAARLMINNLFWYGNVELHINEQDWYNHEHHRDIGYNGVILHVILNENARKTVRRQDGTIPPTLSLKTRLPDNLHRFIRKFKQHSPKKRLPCSHHPDGLLRDDLFLQQLSRSHRAYFYQKVYDQYRFWDHSLPWFAAWKKMLTLSLFDGLGITHNRESMVRLARHLFRTGKVKLPKEQLINRAQLVASNDGHSTSQTNEAASSSQCLYFNWNCKGVRPTNRPASRIAQAVELLKEIQKLSKEQILLESPETIWDDALLASSIDGLGKKRANMLYAISLLPCLKIAAMLNDDHDRGRRIQHGWNIHRVPLPKRFSRVLDSTQLNPDIYSRCLGAVYQLRYFCFKHRCEECLIFKNAFNA